MEKSTKQYLVNRYNRIPRKTKATCLKYHYRYNGVHVNVYFDALDVKSVSLGIVLVHGTDYYYSPLNILNTGTASEYLSRIPSGILSKILDAGRLATFFADMERHLLEDKPYVNYYNGDKYFVNTVKHSKNKLDMPFWWYLRKVPMSDKTLRKLSARADISMETLKKVQQAGFTLVRTGDPEKRKDILLILEDIVTIEKSE